MLKITIGGFDNKTEKEMSTQNWSFCGFYTFFWSFCVFSLLLLILGRIHEKEYQYQMSTKDWPLSPSYERSCCVEDRSSHLDRE